MRGRVSARPAARAAYDRAIRKYEQAARLLRRAFFLRREVYGEDGLYVRHAEESVITMEGQHHRQLKSAGLGPDGEQSKWPTWLQEWARKPDDPGRRLGGTERGLNAPAGPEHCPADLDIVFMIE